MGPIIEQLTFQSVWDIMGAEVILVLTGFALLVLDLFLDKEQKKLVPWLGILSLIIAGGLVVRNMINIQSATEIGQLSGYLYVMDDYGSIFKLIFIVGSILTLLISIDYLNHVKLPKSEYTYLLLFATVGAMVMASSLDLITIFIGLELLSIASYILVGMRRDSAKSAEAAMKYLVVGAVGTALTLYGMSFIYGLTGTTNIAMAMDGIAGVWADFEFLVMLSLVMMLAGIGIKISMVPFQMWTPDTYEGAPTPITAFLSAVSKAAAFAMLFRVVLFLFSSHINEWYLILVVLAALTMLVGNVAAVTQKNIKRLMAYSSIAQAGYLLVPIAVLGKAQSGLNVFQSLSEIVFYLAAYVLVTMGAFAIISLVTRDADSEHIESFRGLYQRSPFLAISMSIFLLSMAGMPITAGFFGKFLIILGAIHNQSFWLAGIMFGTSVISFYYYFGIMRLMFKKETDGIEPKLQTSGTLSLVVGIALIVTIGLGVMPDALMDVLGKLAWFGKA